METACLYFILVLALVPFANALIMDPSGYITFCPCMGRFGNQIEQFLGVLSLAKQINRTLLLPPLVEFPSDRPQAQMVPFSDLFDVKEVQKYHRALPLDVFMRELAPTVWPKERRFAFCYGPRKSIYDDTAPFGCHAKEGNPAGPFWDYATVTFVKDEYYGQMSSNGNFGRGSPKLTWDHSFPTSQYPVLAFTGAPAAFPIKAEDRHLQQFLKWRPRIQNQAINFIKEELPRPFIGIHLRNQVDWDNVCRSVREGQKTDQLFASPQCLGYDGEHGSLTPEICAPSEATVLDDVEEKVKLTGAKAVFVSSDKDHLLPELNDRLERHGARAVKLTDNDPYVSLAVLSKADLFVGNCVSTYTAFVVRAREFGSRQDLRENAFFGFHPEPRRKIEL